MSLSCNTGASSGSSSGRTRQRASSLYRRKGTASSANSSNVGWDRARLCIVSAIPILRLSQARTIATSFQKVPSESGLPCLVRLSFERANRFDFLLSESTAVQMRKRAIGGFLPSDILLQRIKREFEEPQALHAGEKARACPGNLLRRREMNVAVSSVKVGERQRRRERLRRRLVEDLVDKTRDWRWCRHGCRGGACRGGAGQLAAVTAKRRREPGPTDSQKQKGGIVYAALRVEYKMTR